MGLLGCFYFLGLVFHFPFWLTVSISLVAVAASIYFVVKNSPFVAIKLHLSGLSLILFCYCLILLALNVSAVATKHGGWDAWAIWNLHARYLTDPERWHNLFLNSDTEHPDYPLGQPAILAFFTRLFGGHLTFWSFVFAWSLTLAIPLLLFFRLYFRSSVVAFSVLFIWCSSAIIPSYTTSEYADTFLSFLLLAAIVAAEDGSSPFLCSFFLACMPWVKNEGFLLSAIFLIFNIRLILKGAYRAQLIAGAAIPVFCFVLFRVICPVKSDMLAGLGPEMIGKLKDGQRYYLIYNKLYNVIHDKFHFIWNGFLLTGIISLLQHRRPDGRLYMLLLCLASYMAIYVITPHDLEWHLSTSLDRLIFQLVPSFLYLFGCALSAVQYNISVSGRRDAELENFT